jgi:hypothetical protein
MRFSDKSNEGIPGKSYGEEENFTGGKEPRFLNLKQNKYEIRGNPVASVRFS